jgi:hypothetical protein
MTRVDDQDLNEKLAGSGIGDHLTGKFRYHEFFTGRRE